MRKPTLPADFDEFIKTGSYKPEKFALVTLDEPSEPMLQGVKRARLAKALKIALREWNITRTSLSSRSGITESQIDKARDDTAHSYSKAKAKTLASGLGLTLTQLIELGKEDLSKHYYQKLQRKVLKQVSPCGLNRHNQIRRFRDRMPKMAN